MTKRVTVACGGEIEFQQYLHWEEKGAASVVATENLATEAWCIIHLTHEAVEKTKIDIVTLW